MCGEDYNGEFGEVLEIVSVKDYEMVKEYSTSGWLDKDSAKQLDKSEFLVAVNGPEYGYYGGPGTEVFMYGIDGFVVYSNTKTIN